MAFLPVNHNMRLYHGYYDCGYGYVFFMLKRKLTYFHALFSLSPHKKSWFSSVAITRSVSTTQLKFNQENVAKALEKFQALSDEHEVCYLNDSTVPVLVLKPRLYGNSFFFKEYFTEEKPKVNVPNKSVIKLDKYQVNVLNNIVEYKGFLETQKELGLDSTKKAVIWVVLDYAGLSTNVEDLKEFLRLPITSEVEIYETEVLLQDQKAIKKFDCRTRPIQRSL
ncbi:uncharacterized protein BX663DRAFT_539719 [Cokeromyces recurvatus]|uniref:uncharacterized protein n=1 Tax=Cokeromyces recurvatus TaxID=90255 RepID=UPI00221E68EC|nr:uncharacterized protein BX663DRAFT_539719 [Cokeromyces recurvatus]KAI7906936.1 hypothetical protein BX663DRAFT_539719 [Cokeromyces recurvatus]